MNAKELRIGNYISIPKTIVFPEIQETISALGIDIHLKNNCYKPIPLTEEWLLKFGFDRLEYSINGLTAYAIENFRIAVLVDECFNAYDVIWWNYLGHTPLIKDNDAWELCELPYVHTFQNAVFSLTGEELTIKENVK